MFEKLKRRLFPVKEMPSEVIVKEKPILITIHGYGRRRKHEMDNLVLWSKQEDFEIIQFNMYDLFDEHDCEWIKWIDRAKEVVQRYASSDRDVYLLGFSMGGVIASYLAATTPNIKKLILLAPAFNYLHVETIASVISKGAASLFGNEKEKKNEIEVPRSFYNAFMEVIKNLKRYIADVQCPVLILHGDIDEVIPLRSSTWAYDKIAHNQKKLIVLHNGHHRLLMDEEVNWECYQIIRLFLDNKILNGDTIPQSPDILKQYEKERMEREVPSQQEMEKENCEVN